MIRSIVIFSLLFSILLGCNTPKDDVEVDLSKKEPGENSYNSPPSKVAENGSCMANTLSFLVGQPETALQAMQYPENTRILIYGQVVDSFVDPTRLNLVIGLDRNISFVYCG